MTKIGEDYQMKKTKILTSIFLVSALLLSGCQADNQATSNGVEASEDVSVEVTEEAVASEAAPEEAIASDKQEEIITIPQLTLSELDIPDTEAFQFVENMKIGWNLGNTFDATVTGTVADELTIESTWSGAITTKEMIDAVKEAGFQTIRIPVSWHNHLIDEEFTISEAWMNRVQEVVDYAVANDLYIILNIHHDIDFAYYYPTTPYLENSTKYVTAIWSQVAAKFADYDDHLIFESVNEPRMTGTNYEWWLDPAQESCKDAVNCINQLNQTFVDTVRAAGGSNESRYLMVPGYGASPDGALNENFLLPTDTVSDKMIVSVHAYTPYKFALQAMGEVGATDRFNATSASSTGDIDGFLTKIYTKFVANGIPVVIGEFGARDKDGNLQDRVDYATYYIAAAKSRGITCCWWDNNAFLGEGENFGLLDRKSLEWKYPLIMEGLMKYSE